MTSRARCVVFFPAACERKSGSSYWKDAFIIEKNAPIATPVHPFCFVNRSHTREQGIWGKAGRERTSDASNRGLGHATFGSASEEVLVLLLLLKLRPVVLCEPRREWLLPGRVYGHGHRQLAKVHGGQETDADADAEAKGRCGGWRRETHGPESGSISDFAIWLIRRYGYKAHFDS
jgi:hypothetical protein